MGCLKTGGGGGGGGGEGSSFETQNVLWSNNNNVWEHWILEVLKGNGKLDWVRYLGIF